MKKQTISLIIPLVLSTGLIIQCWIIILTTDILANWRHYTGLGLFLILIVLYFKSYKLTIIGTGIFLILATFNVLSITAQISTSGLKIGPIQTPSIQLLSLGLFILYFILNFDAIIDIYLKYKNTGRTKDN